MKPFLSFGKIKNTAGTIHKQCQFIPTPNVISLSGDQGALVALLAETAIDLPAGKSIVVDLPRNVQTSWGSYDFMGPELTVTRDAENEVSLSLAWESENADRVWIEGPAALFAGMDDPVWHEAQVALPAANTDGVWSSESAMSL